LLVSSTYCANAMGCSFGPGQSGHEVPLGSPGQGSAQMGVPQVSQYETQTRGGGFLAGIGGLRLRELVVRGTEVPVGPLHATVLRAELLVAGRPGLLAG
jgi:hypothetical protein